MGMSIVKRADDIASELDALSRICVCNLEGFDQRCRIQRSSHEPILDRVEFHVVCSPLYSFFVGGGLCICCEAYGRGVGTNPECWIHNNEIQVDVVNRYRQLREATRSETRQLIKSFLPLGCDHCGHSLGEKAILCRRFMGGQPEDDKHYVNWWCSGCGELTERQYDPVGARKE